MDECYGKSLLWRNGCGVFPDLHYGILSAPASFLWCVLSGTEAKYFIVHRDVCNDGVYDVAGGDGICLFFWWQAPEFAFICGRIVNVPDGQLESLPEYVRS